MIFQEDIFKMFRELFQAAISEPPPKGIGHSPQSRAIYGVDLILKWETNSRGISLFCHHRGARCSSMVRAFAHGAMGHRIDPSWVGPIELFLVPASAPRLV